MSTADPLKTGRIDVHAHLLPGVDDGCQSLDDSLECARGMVRAGYTHLFCTPHIWPNLPNNTPAQICQWTEQLQVQLDIAQIPLRLLPGGELNLQSQAEAGRPEEPMTFAMAGKYVLADFWANELPPYVEPEVRWLQSLGLRVILAHPERMRAVQDDPSLMDLFRDMGMLLQGNLQCLTDPLDKPSRRLAERFLLEGRYFLLGSDLHNPASLLSRLGGLHRAIELIGVDGVAKLTIENPRQLLPT